MQRIVHRPNCARDCWLAPCLWSVGSVLLAAVLTLLGAAYAGAQDSFFDGYLVVEDMDGNFGLDGTNGFVMDFPNSDDEFGRAVSGAGDVNGDGIDDFVIGAPLADPNGDDGAGEAFVVFGSASGFPASLDITALDGTNGFVVQGASDDAGVGIAVGRAGDVNDDGIDDLLLGAGGLTRGYILFGSQTPFPASLPTSSLDGSNGFAINGAGYSFSIDGTGDVNGDAIADFVIGGSDGTVGAVLGKSYLVFGSSSGFPSTLELSALNGANGFTMSGSAAVVNPRIAVSGAGDVNGDGIGDILVGDPYITASGGFREGESYVVFGSASGFPATLDLGTLDGENGFAMLGEEATYSGWSVSGAGDVNGDGVDDVVIGAPELDFDFGGGFVGKSYVVFGSMSGFPAALDLGALDGSDGFAVVGDCGAFPGDCLSDDRAGDSVSGAGDVNGDGFDDILIGAPDYDYSAEAYVIFGTDGGFPAVINVGSTDGSSGLLDGTNGFAIEDYPAYDLQSVSGMGDVNGDGIADVIVGQVSSSTRPGGRSYVIFGAQREVVPEPSSTALIGLAWVCLGTMRQGRTGQRG